MMKNRLFILIMALALALPLYAEDVTGLPENTSQSAIVQTDDEDLIQEEMPEVMKTQLKQPVSKRKVAKKFLLAMLGVGASSFFIYFGLTLYNKFRDGVLTANNNPPLEEDTSLDTPSDLSEAVKTFIDKTTWN